MHGKLYGVEHLRIIYMTPHSGNIAKWMGENVEEIMRDSRDRAIDGENWCEVISTGKLGCDPDI